MIPSAARAILLRAPLRANQPASLLRIAARRAYTSTREAKAAAENAFIKERVATKHHAAETAELWRKLSIYIVIPALIVSSINAYNLWTEHWDHVAHDTPIEEKPEYPYQNIRSKNFFWGDGDKTLFWNDSVNYHKQD
ncbi:cytochrome c oxidase subunit VIa-domain-containing protein [Terfezia claveryi]|nr:cytochrome c oxidase subunit VIa-domain-containing protein [Terfezia claveryi]